MATRGVEFTPSAAVKIKKVVTQVLGKAPTLSPRPQVPMLPQETQLGVIVCYGPNGEGDFNDCRYWVQFARLNTSAGDPHAMISVEPDSTGIIVTATDEFESNAQTHHVPPGTWVILHGFTSVYDGITLWAFNCGDMVSNGQSCEGSGSGSETSVCYCIWTLVYDCTTRSITSFTGATSCGNTAGTPDNTWSLSSTDGTTCTWISPQRSNIPCSSNGDCTTADGGALCSPGNRPDPPGTALLESCCTPGSLCWELWSLEYFCPADGSPGGFNEPEYENSTCGNQSNMVPNTWTIQNTGNTTNCLWYCIVPTTNMCSSTVPCPQVTTNPSLPPNPAASTCNCTTPPSTYCYDLYFAVVQCTDGTPSVISGYPAYSGTTVCGLARDPPPGVWTKTGSNPAGSPPVGGDPTGSCRYLIYVQTTNTCTPGVEGEGCTSTQTISTPTIPSSVYMSCCDGKGKTPCPTGGGNYAWCCINGVEMWVPIVNGCPGSGS